MATETHVSRLRTIAGRVINYPIDRILRPKQGASSLVGELSDGLGQLQKRAKVASELCPILADREVVALFQELEQAYDRFDQIANLDDAQFVRARDDSAIAVTRHLDSVTSLWHPFALAQLERFGLLDADLEQILQGMESRAQVVISEFEKTIEERKSELRNLVRDVSIEDAEKAFNDAKKHHRNQAVAWGGLSAITAMAFGSTAFYFYGESVVGSDGWGVLYFTAIRLTILTAIAGVSAFCLKVLRSHLHRHQQNHHKYTLAKSLPTLIRAGESPQQRDLIFSQLVDALADFGSSGLITGKEESIHPSRVVVDSVARNLPRSTS